MRKPSLQAAIITALSPLVLVTVAAYYGPCHHSEGLNRVNHQQIFHHEIYCQNLNLKSTPPQIYLYSNMVGGWRGEGGNHHQMSGNRDFFQNIIPDAPQTTL